MISGLKLFGESYSGLEYDYKGLCNVYTKLSEAEKLFEFTQVLETWRIIREENNDVSTIYSIDIFDRHSRLA